MRDRPGKTSTTTGHTGELPIVPDTGLPHEPPMPSHLPEFPGVSGATGQFPVVPEGEDKARQDDDSATTAGSAPASVARTGR